MTFYIEAGPAYFNEDFISPLPDQISFRGRVAMKWDWPLFDGKIDLYHNDEMFPSLQNFSEFYFTMNNGLHFKILNGLTSGFQVTTRTTIGRPSAGPIPTICTCLYWVMRSTPPSRDRLAAGVQS